MKKMRRKGRESNKWKERKKENLDQRRENTGGLVSEKWQARPRKDNLRLSERRGWTSLSHRSGGDFVFRSNILSCEFFSPYSLPPLIFSPSPPPHVISISVERGWPYFCSCLGSCLLLGSAAVQLPVYWQGLIMASLRESYTRLMCSF